MAYKFDIDSVGAPQINTDTTEMYTTYEDYVYNSNIEQNITPGWEYAWSPDVASGSLINTGLEWNCDIINNNISTNIDKHKQNNRMIENYKAIKIQKAWRKYIKNKKNNINKIVNVEYIKSNLIPAFLEGLITDTQFWNKIHEYTDNIDKSNISALDKLRIYKSLYDIEFTLYDGLKYNIISELRFKCAQDKFLKC